jgi:hypothetical protein
MRGSWEPASAATVTAVWERFRDLTEPEVARAFCRLVRSRPTEEWPGSALERLVSLALEYPDPKPGTLIVQGDKSVDEATVAMLLQDTINCVRGVAAEAIGQLLWHHCDWLDRLEPGIAALVSDPHPVVRMAALYALLPVVNIDAERAVAWFCAASQDDPRIPASAPGIRFLNGTMPRYAGQLSLSIRNMVESSRPEVAHQGAQAVTAYSLFYELYEGELARVISGTVPHRSGVARIAAHHVADAAYAHRCRELLAPLFNDPEEEVREATSTMFGDGFFGLCENADLATRYVDSKAYVDDPSKILRSLERHGGSLVPLHRIVLAVCRRAVNHPICSRM